MNLAASAVGERPHRAREGPTWILLAVLTGVALYLSWRIAQPFAIVILWSVVLALMFAPLHRKLLVRTGRPNLSAAVTLFVAVVCVLLPLGVLSIAVAAEVGDLVDQAPERWNAWAGDRVLQKDLARWREDLEQRFPFVARIDSARIKESLTQLGESMVKHSVGVVGAALQAVVGFVIIVFSLFFLLRDADKFERVLRSLLPLSPRQSDLLIGRTVEVIHASVLGVVAIAALQGALGGILFATLGLPSPILWGVVMAFFAMIPMVGAGIVWLPAALFLLVTGHVTKGIVLLAVGMLVISTIDNFLRPRLVGGRTGLHELVVFFSVLGGLKLIGTVGLFVGPAIFAISWSLLDLFRETALGGPSPARGVEPGSARSA